MGTRLKEILLRAGALPYLVLSIMCFVLAVGFYLMGIMGPRLLRWPPVVAFGCGGVFTLGILLVMLVVGAAPVLRGRKLKAQGRFVWAKVTGFEGPSSGKFRAIYSKSHVVECTAELDGKKRQFKSARIYHDPKLRRGQKVQVWYDEIDVRKYYVDVGGYLK